ncbi:MAG: SpoIIE family protein phosphatase [Candidatus Eremiobacteraeota bacterium]|nr:SpoIIE family protein phosphatase [Candidatus Eremiobacteraeota bacterium]MBV9737599.1 SpoIIE family protein phosphatase [Candidatus Eremiobacteraeota bacterium]
MQAFRGLIRGAGALTATAILAFGLFIAVNSTLATRAATSAAFERERGIQNAQLALSELLKLQVDEETAVRGFTITRENIFLEPYYAASVQFAPHDRDLSNVLADERMTEAQAALHELEQAHDEWHQLVAEPLIARPSTRYAIDLAKRGKALIDAERNDAAEIQMLLTQRDDQMRRQTQDEINRTGYSRAGWLVAFGLIALLFNAYQSRLTRELEQERTTTETLQRAFQSEFESIPHTDIGSAYISATRHVAIGGDVFDLYRMTDRLALMLIADVSGKGVDAAVITAFIKFTIRGIALRRNDPAEILAEFNTAFQRAVLNPDLFVSMLVGVLDVENRTLTYASGGHDSVYLRRANGGVESLPVTGPILGVMEQPFTDRVVQLEPGDLLLLATDGLAESRDRKGQQLNEPGVLSWLAQADGGAQQIVDGLVARVRQRTHNQLGDDLALLAIRIERDGVPLD